MVAAGALGLGHANPPASLRQPYIEVGMDVLVIGPGERAGARVLLLHLE